MELYPAIDLRGGRCVRLLHGDFAQETVYGDDPVARAGAFAAAGAPWIHIVDLDAARTGDPVNRPVIEAIVDAVDVRVQAGGGIRDDASADALLDAGVARVVVGTAALEAPDWARSLAMRNPNRVAVGLDVRCREVAVRGWLEGSGRSIADVATEFDGHGFAAVIATQIQVDGTGAGPDLDLYRELLATVETAVVASGGVGHEADLTALASLAVEGRTVAGAIVGRALYDGSLSVAAALAATATPD